MTTKLPWEEYIERFTQTGVFVDLAKEDLAVMVGFAVPGSTENWRSPDDIRNDSQLGFFALNVPLLPYNQRRQLIRYFIKLIYEPTYTSEIQRELLTWFVETKEQQRTDQQFIKVGVLHSLTGTMAISETALVDATLMAIDEINQAGGLLGKLLKPVVVDGASDPTVFAREAERLILDEGVVTIFGGWTSASRKTMKPIIERRDHLLWYPVQYEGLEQSPNIIYGGAAPNQQVLPAVNWAIDTLGTSFYLVGSDYVFPRSANVIMRELIERRGGTVVGEEYELLGEDRFQAIVKDIKQKKPAVILNTINGDGNLAFFKELRRAKIMSTDIPTISFSLAEAEINATDPTLLAGDYAAWSYFQSIDSPANRTFVSAFKARYGENRVTDDPIETAYFCVYLFAEAVKRAGTAETALVRQATNGLAVAAPEGTVRIDDENHHVYRSARVGQITPDGQFSIVWSSQQPIRPEPYPASRSPQEWHTFLEGMYTGWGDVWLQT